MTALVNRVFAIARHRTFFNRSLLHQASTISSKRRRKVACGSVLMGSTDGGVEVGGFGDNAPPDTATNDTTVPGWAEKSPSKYFCSFL